ncbi:MAG: 50S ribosomal protein L4 [Candidatus Yanofskybacteria bacterium RIFCSPHIGHO2_02_FULL_41_29]|uniref:Large ribosomal subunit protein uL4 n=1 Tax=Candidatus Yanofskybacteria bacterium RIFCSPHIGHO2_01_FULL_41_53 TaxID=1802663 RepID=A0A1F8EJU8_9BACT|nr:MAG: 50S ribosomal protein L4 [Candidatus Yanofskybacteria bacterium RIFCSPHIGHO2_01_FULL_41_53]OGN11599.1 MAG: 50S ribosomal protein L4 [Candidatus Yanofskybacteria bacterium RIFCSPHIGHO2_02_FULL_41_29]OGN18181.1 MAG: 50S ribosomal protein L4 [Candidatus Yanofskybacteria bacterium RIFCSPHIGHO2_12_FULL_41_9]OGN22836.1 MAG: 50S ribosomal protein L4 [Candidatus Yanofskybacteria bacterium RIFCSPLOWO2_01_FULL_41_67]OGN30103.1 MAG: 50S ribosomal protein L4 [Candidatus Yanofskybacteria bacterium R
MEVNLYNQSAKNVGKVKLPDAIFGLPLNKDLLYQVVTSQMANKRQNIAHTKDRGEVRGGGKKPWRQKGTGRARHGSIRSPIWKGGGVTFGPRKERVFKKKINKKMARKALFLALSSKVKDKEMIVIDGIAFNSWKTKEMAVVVNKISELFSSKHSSLLLVTDKKMGDTIERVSRNLPRVDVMEAKNLNALDVIARKNLVILKDSLNVIEKNFKV